MKLLAIETATLTAGAAVWRNDRVVAQRRARVTTHSEALLPLIDEVLRESGVRPAELDGIACGAGPGSFTGLRIGLATAKGLCFALGRPLVMVSALEALAARAPDGRICATLDAFKSEVYAGFYDVVEGCPRQLEEPRVLPPDELAVRLRALAPCAIVGDGALRYPELELPGVGLLDRDPAPRPDETARLGAARLARGDTDDLARAQPSYIRPSEPELLKLRLT